MKIYSKNKVGIRLTNERLKHIVINHPEMMEYFTDIPKIIRDPDIVFEGLRKEYIAVKRKKSFFLVIIYKEEETDGFVITAFRARNIRYLLKRKILWKKE